MLLSTWMELKLQKCEIESSFPLDLWQQLVSDINVGKVKKIRQAAQETVSLSYIIFPSHQNILSQTSSE